MIGVIYASSFYLCCSDFSKVEHFGELDTATTAILESPSNMGIRDPERTLPLSSYSLIEHKNKAVSSAPNRK